MCICVCARMCVAVGLVCWRQERSQGWFPGYVVHGVLIHQMRYAVGLVISWFWMLFIKSALRTYKWKCPVNSWMWTSGAQKREPKWRTVLTNVLCVYLFLVAWFQHISSTEAGIKVSVLPNSVSLSMCTYLLIILLYVLLNIGNCG